MNSKNVGGQSERGINADFSDVPFSGKHQSVILIADNDIQIRKIVAFLLTHDGHFVLSAAADQEGLTLLRQYAGSIDLVITDMEMLRPNGTELCAHLLECRPGIKLLGISSADVAGRSTKTASFPLLLKPFDGPTLKARVREILAFSVQPSLP